MMQGDREDRIRRRAHEIWEREGHPEGRHDVHWAQACAEIDAEDRTGSEDAGLVKKVVRRTKKAAADAVGAGLNAVVDVVEEALAPKKTRARKAKDETADAAKDRQLPVVKTGSHAVATTDTMAEAEAVVKSARGKAAKTAGKASGAKPRPSSKAAGQNREAAH